MIKFSNKLFVFLCLFGMVTFLQAKTILDAQNMISNAIKHQKCLGCDADSIKAIIREKINNNDEIAALEHILHQFKEELIQKKGCISSSTLNTMRRAAGRCVGISFIPGVFASEVFLIGATGRTISLWIESLAKTYPSFNKNAIEIFTKIGGRKPNTVNGIVTYRQAQVTSIYNMMGKSLIVAGASFSVVAVMYKITQMLENAANKQSAIVDNIRTIDSLLEYLHYEKGLAAQ